jgi:hypothetical protein
MRIDKGGGHAAWYVMPFLDIAGEDSLVRDYQHAAGEIFPLMAKADNPFLRDQYGIAFANIIGNPGEFYQYVTGAQGERNLHVERLLESFEANLSLLVGKTWVENNSQKAREAVLSEMRAFLAAFREASYAKALRLFLSMSNQLTALIFGEQAGQRDFPEYAFRIEPKFGLFVWFLHELESQRDSSGDGKGPWGSVVASGHKADLVRLELLIGMYFLSVL